MGDWPYDIDGNEHPERIATRKRIGPPSQWGGAWKIPDQLLAWTKAEPISATIARRVLQWHDDMGMLHERPRFLTQWSFGKYPEYLHALEKLWLIEPRTSIKHGGIYYVPLPYLWAWSHLALNHHKESPPCLFRSMLSSLPVISPATQKSVPPVPPPSPPSVSP